MDIKKGRTEIAHDVRPTKDNRRGREKEDAC